MTVLILGATSEMALALARYYASKQYHIQLAARNKEELAAMKSDIQIRYNVPVSAFEFDALNYSSHQQWYHALPEKPDIVILAFGYLGDHSKAIADDFQESIKIIGTNYMGVVSILNVIANDFQKKGKGVIAAISSVAGERGRMSNYLYGSAKAGLTAYLSGLRNRLFHSGVHVMTVNPGFVRTKMTEGLPLPKSVTTDPQKVAELIFRGIEKKKNVIYILPIWALIMLVIRTIPEVIFKRLKL